MFALVTADASPDARERARARFAEHPDDMMAAAAVEPHARWLRETQRRLAFRAAWQRYFADHDVFVLPTTFTAAFVHNPSMSMEERVVDTPEGPRSYVRDLGRWIAPASLAGLPVTVAPVGMTAGRLPVGLQIVAPMWEDATAVECAALLAEVTGGFTPPPAFAE